MKMQAGVGVGCASCVLCAGAPAWLLVSLWEEATVLLCTWVSGKKGLLGDTPVPTHRPCEQVSPGTVDIGQAVLWGSILGTVGGE